MLARTLMQKIPGKITAGTYTYTIKVGTFSGTVSSSGSFSFDKTASDQSPRCIGETKTCFRPNPRRVCRLLAGPAGMVSR
jgi:hypothetical protein